MRAQCLFVALIFLMSACRSMDGSKGNQAIINTKNQQEQREITPWRAVQELKEGNERFLTGQMRERDLALQVASSLKQFPFAVILSCMDSRGSPEIIFDQGIGDIFAERLAGNVVNPDVLGGMEFATKITGAKLVVVLGHTACGAIQGACDKAELGNLTTLLDKIKPAVKTVHKRDDNKSCDASSVDAMAEQNVRNMIEQVKKHSPVLMKMLKQGKIGIIGGMHDLTTGKVTFFEDKKMLPGAPQQ